MKPRLASFSSHSFTFAFVLAACLALTPGPSAGAITINGKDASLGSGEGWTCYGPTVTLHQASATYVVSGSSNNIALLATADCTVVASNLSINATSALANCAALDCGTNAVTLALWSDDDYENKFYGGANSAGICVASNTTTKASGSLVITNWNEAGAVYVKGAGTGIRTAGIGSGSSGIGGRIHIAGGSVRAVGGGATGGPAIGGPYAHVIISGGKVTATGGSCAPGIGGGRDGGGTLIEISGGRVTASASQWAAGIGAGRDSGSKGTRVYISGGTIRATSDLQGIGNGGVGGTIAALKITGGSVYSYPEMTSVLPTDLEGAYVCKVIVPGLTANAAVNITGLPAGYGVKDIYADVDGRVFLRLPETADPTTFATHTFTANGVEYRAYVSQGGSLAVRPGVVSALGVLVNGVDVGEADGTGWSFRGNRLLFNAAGPFTVSGANGGNPVGLFAVTNCTIVASNLSINVSTEPRISALDCGTNAVTLALWSDDAFENKFNGGAYSAGICVASNTTTGASGSLVITNWNEAGAVYANTPGYGTRTAGIGSGSSGTGGRIHIAGGSVKAVGGGSPGGPAVGGPYAHVIISGGKVTATGGSCAPGIGGGRDGGGTLIEISGGRVTASASQLAAGIGAGRDSGSKGTRVYISGGTIRATSDSRGIGNGTSGRVAWIKVTGGSVYSSLEMTSPRPTDLEGNTVWKVTVTGLVANAAVNVTGLPAGYGVKDIFADDAGKIYPWLPDSPSTRRQYFYANNIRYAYNVSGANTNATIWIARGTTIFLR